MSIPCCQLLSDTWVMHEGQRSQHAFQELQSNVAPLDDGFYLLASVEVLRNWKHGSREVSENSRPSFPFPFLVEEVSSGFEQEVGNKAL